MSNYQNSTEIRRALDIFKPNGALIEIRAMSGKTIYSGYFRKVDELLKKIENTRETWYFVLNEIDESCYSRDQNNKILQNPKDTTKDKEISGRDWILIDADPARASGISSSDEEKKKAKEIIGKVYNFLKSKGFSEPVMADSGNGYHLLYNMSAANDEQKTTLIKNFLNVLQLYFGDEFVSIDTSVFNASRITKLYGTLAQKGANTADRPHRFSKICHVPEKIEKTSLALIKQIADMLPKPQENQGKGVNNNSMREKFDLRNFIMSNGMRVKSETKKTDCIMFMLEECVFDPSHKGKDAAIFEYTDGKIGYKCFHNSCSAYSWRDVRLKFEPDAYDKPNQYNGARYISSDPSPNYQNQGYNPKPFTQLENQQPDIIGQPIFYVTEQIRQLETPQEEFIETGIALIDKKVRGLKKGAVTLFSGLRAAAKSSVLSQIAVNAAEQGYKAALFSGELQAKNVYTWLLKQAAGSDYIRATQYENYYILNEEVEEPISKWLNEKVYIYNNDYGNNFSWIIDKLTEIVKEKQTDLIILDNLMALDITMLANRPDDKYTQQSRFVLSLKRFAEANNVHIVFVAHPRKAQGFLRLEDIGGAGDLSNAADNVFIIHRVNHDFIKKTGDEYDHKMPGNENQELYQATNVIEICKDRANGLQDFFVPLYYDPASKRLMNARDEKKAYSWDKPNGGIIVTDAVDDPDLPVGW